MLRRTSPATLLDPVDRRNQTIPEAKSYVRDDQEAGNLIPGNAHPISFGDSEVRLVLNWFNYSKRTSRGTGAPHVVKLPGMTLLTISEHRDVYPVVSGGKRGIKGFTRGHKTTAGSLGFVSYGRNPFEQALLRYMEWTEEAAGSLTNISPDEMPPMDLHITMHTYENIYAIFIKGLNIVDSSRIIGVDDPQVTEVYSYIAARATITHALL